jgi:hypothetical protein
MDATGDAYEADDRWDDELRQMSGRSVWTPEARAFTAVGLVLASMLTFGLFQFLAFFISRDGLDPRTQPLFFAGPSAVLSAVGALVGWRARQAPLSPVLRGLVVATAVVGGVVASLAGLGVVAAMTSDSRQF